MIVIQPRSKVWQGIDLNRRNRTRDGVFRQSEGRDNGYEEEHLRRGKKIERIQIGEDCQDDQDTSSILHYHLDKIFLK